MEDELMKLRGDHKMKLHQILGRSWKYIKKEIGWVLLSLFFIIVTVAFEIIMPMLVMYFVNFFDEQNIANTTLNMIIGIALGHLGLALIGQGARYLQSILLQRSGQRIVYNLRMEVFSHIEHM